MITFKTAAIKGFIALMLSLVTVMTMVSYVAADSSNTVTVVDNDQTKVVVTHCKTAEDILNEAGIKLLAGDKVDFNLKGGKGELKITRSFEVYITVDNVTTMLRMTKGTVAEALKRAQITLGEFDVCSLDPETVISENTFIDIMNVSYTTESYTEVIPFTSKVEYSSSLEKGKKVVTGGENGLKTVTLKNRYENGKVISSQVVSTEITKKPVEKKTVIGTKSKESLKVSSSTAGKKTVSALAKPASLKLDKNGIPTSYKKSMTFKASAYTSGPNGICSTGVKAQTGYIAVNPKIIPYGTKMYIVTNDGQYVYGYAVAKDTGGFAKKNPYMVDLYFNSKSECRTFGIRNVTIYFL